MIISFIRKGKRAGERAGAGDPKTPPTPMTVPPGGKNDVEVRERSFEECGWQEMSL